MSIKIVMSPAENKPIQFSDLPMGTVFEYQIGGWFYAVGIKLFELGWVQLLDGSAIYEPSFDGFGRQITRVFTEMRLS